MSAEITKIVLKLGRREVELTVDEARALKAALAEMFGQDVVREIVRDNCHHWHWGYAYPQWNTGGVGTGAPMLGEPYTISYAARTLDGGDLIVSCGNPA